MRRPLRRAWWWGTTDPRAGKGGRDRVPALCTPTACAVLACALACAVLACALACAVAGMPGLYVAASGVAALRFGAWLQRIDDDDANTTR